MTNEQAVEKLKILKEDYWDDDGYGHESKLYDDTALALDMAIKALEKRKTGRWEHIGGDEWVCSECGHVISTEGSWEHPKDTGKDFCEHCGAKMEGSEEE